MEGIKSVIEAIRIGFSSVVSILKFFIDAAEVLLNFVRTANDNSNHILNLLGAFLPEEIMTELVVLFGFTLALWVVRTVV